jgi:hypothetical protein
MKSISINNWCEQVLTPSERNGENVKKAQRYRIKSISYKTCPEWKFGREAGV